MIGDIFACVFDKLEPKILVTADMMANLKVLCFVPIQYLFKVAQLFFSYIILLFDTLIIYVLYVC